MHLCETTIYHAGGVSEEMRLLFSVCAGVAFVRNYIVFLLVIKCAVRTEAGRENVTLLEVSQEPQVGAHTPHGKIHKFR